MMGRSLDGCLKFDRFGLDLAAGRLLRIDVEGASVPVAIGARALAVLCVLAERSGEVVAKQAIIDAVWPDTTVDDKNVAVQVSTLRQTLEREGGQADWIQTVSGRGYRFLAPLAHEVEQAVGQPAAAPDPSARGAPRRGRAGPRPRLTLAVCGACVLLVGAASLELSRRYNALPAAYSPQDRRQSIIVLPFDNGSSEASRESVAAGLTRDLTDEIAEDPAVPLVPMASAGLYRGGTPDLRRVGRDHDVRFALTGNARQQESRLIVAATLYTTEDARPIWSRRFDQPDTREALAGIVRRIRSGVDQATMEEDFARAQREHPQRLDKRDLMFAMSRQSLMQPSGANVLAQLELIDRALALDPNYVWALRESARKRANLVNAGLSADPATDLAVAADNIDRALLLAPNEFYTLREKAVVLRAQGHWAEAAALNRRLIERRPLDGYRYHQLGSVLMAQGLHQEALENFEAARRLAVESDSINMVEASAAAALVANGRYTEAIEQARLAIQEIPPGTGLGEEMAWLALIAAESASGLETEASNDLRRFLSVPRRCRTLAEIHAVRVLAKNAQLLAGLSGAGMPAE